MDPRFRPLYVGLQGGELLFTSNPDPGTYIGDDNKWKTVCGNPSRLVRASGDEDPLRRVRLPSVRGGVDETRDSGPDRDSKRCYDSSP